jgi:hypothetical protein
MIKQFFSALWANCSPARRVFLVLIGFVSLIHTGLAVHSYGWIVFVSPGIIEAPDILVIYTLNTMLFLGLLRPVMQTSWEFTHTNK